MKRLTFATLMLAVAGCSEAATIATEYRGTPMAFAHDGRDYRVTDRPDANKLMITPSLKDSAAYKFRPAPMFGPELEFADAAQAFIAPRKCQVTNARALVEPQFEVTYSCP